MTVFGKNAALALAVVSCWLAGGQKAEAVAFKVHNQTDQEFRMRVHDRGAWREWVTMPPQYWDCPAGGVKRTKHAVEIDVRDGEEWVPFYRNSHGTKTFTRVVHLYKDGEGNIVIAWFDEPPTVRSKPVWDGTKINHGKLLKSGWLVGALKGAVKVIKTAAGKIIAKVRVASEHSK
jgi:hypothetical protein